MSEQTREASNGNRGDVLGVICSVGCAIHCAATPVLLAALPSVTSVRWLADPLFHQVVAVLCVILVLRAIVPGWRVHRSPMVAGSAALGLSCLLLAAFVLPDQCCTLPTESSHHEHSHEHDDHNHANLRTNSTTPTVRLVSTSSASQAKTCEHCETHEHEEQHLSSTLLTEAQLSNWFGDEASHQVASIQPYLTPIGGIFLVIAHLLNIRLNCCSSPSCSKKQTS